MTSQTDAALKVFFDVHDGLPRQSAGSEQSTLSALNMVRDRLPQAPVIADMGCGPGSSAIPLALTLPSAWITAFDLHAPFIEEMQARLTSKNLSGRVVPDVADITAPPLRDGSIDLIWCEGAIYNIGVENGLRLWRPFLSSGGVIVFNEAIWLTPEDERPAKVTDFWKAYPQMTDHEGVLSAIDSAGYECFGQLDLTELDWENYYGPMARRLDILETKYSDDPLAMRVLEASRFEIAVRQTGHQHYNYRFYVVEPKR